MTATAWHSATSPVRKPSPEPSSAPRTIPLATVLKDLRQGAMRSPGSIPAGIKSLVNRLLAPPDSGKGQKLPGRTVTDEDCLAAAAGLKDDHKSVITLRNAHRFHFPHRYV